MSESRQSEVVEVELQRNYEPDDPDSDGWSAIWGLEDSEVGIQDEGDDVRKLVNDVIKDIRRRWGADYDLTIEWSVDGWQAQKQLESLGVVLPEELPEPACVASNCEPHLTGEVQLGAALSVGNSDRDHSRLTRPGSGRFGIICGRSVGYGSARPQHWPSLSKRAHSPSPRVRRGPRLRRADAPRATPYQRALRVAARRSRGQRRSRALCATLLFAPGVEAATVQRILRHSSITVTTGTYMEVIERVQREAVSGMDRLLDGGLRQMVSSKTRKRPLRTERKGL